MYQSQTFLDLALTHSGYRRLTYLTVFLVNDTRKIFIEAFLLKKKERKRERMSRRGSNS